MAKAAAGLHFVGVFALFLPKLLSARKRFAQPALMVCSPRAMASASAGTFLVTTEPEPT